MTGGEKEQLRRLLAMTVRSPDIATWAGVEKTSVTNWLARHKNFPQPVAYVGRQPLFDPAEIKAWLRSTGRC